MPAVIDHIFICTAVGAPAAEQLQRLGLTEGSRNRHAGQGTANRRFFFQNFMLELLWVEDAAEAQGSEAREMKLWERWSGAGASPFGIILGPAPGPTLTCPFRSWAYRPATIPGLALQVASDVSLQEPIWYYLETSRPPAPPSARRQPVDHPSGIRHLTGVRLIGPQLPETSVTRTLAGQGVIAWEPGAEHRLELEFDGAPQRQRPDLRPSLPLVCRW